MAGYGFGPASSGSRLYDLDAQQAQAHMAQLAGQQTQNRLGQLKIQSAENDLAVQARIMAGGQPSSADPVKRLQELATKHIDAGSWEQGGKLAKLASEIQENKAQTGAAEAAALARQQEMASKSLEQFASLLGGVQDERGFAQAKAVFAATFGQAAPWAQASYSPELVAQLQRGALSTKEQLDLAIREKNQESLEANRESAIEFRNFRKGILERTARVAEAGEARRQKAGGGSKDKGVAEPTRQERLQASALVRTDYPDLPADELMAAGYDIASRARALRKGNPLLSGADAIKQAYTEAAKTGDFKTVNENYKILGVETPFKKGASPKYVGGGKTKETAIDLGPDPSKWDQGKLVPGRWYMTPSGPKQWKSPQSDSGKVTGVGVDEDEDDDE